MIPVLKIITFTCLLLIDGCLSNAESNFRQTVRRGLNETNSTIDEISELETLLLSTMNDTDANTTDILNYTDTKADELVNETAVNDELIAINNSSSDAEVEESNDEEVEETTYEELEEDEDTVDEKLEDSAEEHEGDGDEIILDELPVSGVEDEIQDSAEENGSFASTFFYVVVFGIAGYAGVKYVRNKKRQQKRMQRNVAQNELYATSDFI